MAFACVSWRPSKFHWISSKIGLRLDSGSRRRLIHHEPVIVLTEPFGGLGLLHEQVHQLFTLVVAQTDFLVQLNHEIAEGRLIARLSLPNARFILGVLFVAKRSFDGLGEERVVSKESRVELGLKRLNVLPDVVELSVQLSDGAAPGFFRLVEETLDITPPCQLQFSLLNLGKSTGSLHIIDLERKGRIELVTTNAGATEPTEEQLIELLLHIRHIQRPH